MYCLGDSGSPLIYQDRNEDEDVLVGITSFGPEICGSRRLPSVATRVSSTVEWIQDVIKNNPSCSKEDQAPVAADPLGNMFLQNKDCWFNPCLLQ